METSASKALPSETKQIHPRISADNKAWLDEEVRKRGVAIGAILDRAIEHYRREDSVATHDTQWIMEGLKYQQEILHTQQIMAGNVGIALEAIGMLARVYLSLTPEEEDKTQAERRGTRRYRRYIDAMAERLRAGQNLITDLPDDVFRKEMSS